MRRFDTSSSFIEWSSEETVIPYTSPVDGRRHRYFIDFKVKKKCPKTGKVTVYLVEVKPKAQTKPPVKTHRLTKRFIQEEKQYRINTAKWRAAEAYCEANGYEFLILTEDHLPAAT